MIGFGLLIVESRSLCVLLVVVGIMILSLGMCVNYVLRFCECWVVVLVFDLFGVWIMSGMFMVLLSMKWILVV